MDIALIGYGRMGHEIESIALSRGHNIKLIIDQDNSDDLNSKNLEKVDVAIEFTFPAAAFKNISTCLTNCTPVVSGTTGWLEKYNEAVDLCKKNHTSFIHSSNFSLGVNLLFQLNRELARHMKRYHDYSVTIEEIHHIKKLDAPSGTALTLSEGIIEEHSEYDGWCSESEKIDGKIPVHSIREGIVTGIHTVKWESEIDFLSIKHEAKTRKGLALGAVVAAEYVHLRKGVFTMIDVMGLR